jgi:hypothetical protein
VNGDLDGVAPVCFNYWPRKLSIDEDHTLLITIRGNQPTSDSEVIAPDDPSIGAIGVWVVANSSKETPREPIWKWVIGKKVGKGWRV